MTTFSERLKELRKNTGCKQTEIAKMLDVQPRTIRFYESGEREPNIDNINKIADYFDVSTDYLLGRSDDPTRL